MLKQLLMAGAGAAAVAGAYTWLVEPHWVEFVRRRLPIRGLPRDLEGRTLVQLSDIHIGPRVDDGFLTRTFEQVAACRPDLVVITGDFVSYSSAEHLEQLRSVLEHVPQGRLGTLAVLGNHDYGKNWSEVTVGDAVAGVAERAGVTVLRNESRIVSGLQIVGVDDFWSPRFDVTRALAARDGDAATVVLCHNPDGVDVSGWDGYEGWILAGHTHGGQCKAPFLPPPLLPVKNRRYTAGEFALAGGRSLYINRGLGHLLKVRFNVRPEVTLFDLTRA
jgi:predicted MPP superfamily phosphohydrolase